MKKVPFSTNSYTDDKYFLVDYEDFEKVSQFNWILKEHNGDRKTPKYYVIRASSKEEKTQGSPLQIYLHRFILNLHFIREPKINRREVDHLDQNTLNNTKSNLEYGTRHRNSQNRKDSNETGEGKWGSVFHKNFKKNPWEAKFTYERRTCYVGVFSTEKEAHETAVKAYIKLTGRKPNI